jgi:hypothetical protein
MPWTRAPSPPGAGGPDLVTEILDPVLVPIGFAPGQVGVAGASGQVIFCRGEIDSPDGACADLVIEVESGPDWRITDVRYWGFPSDRWHLDFDQAAGLPDQLAGLAQRLPTELT